MKPLRYLFLGFVLLCLGQFVKAQTTAINGIVNDYACILSLDCVLNMVTVDDATAFSAGDRCILYQSQGAEFNETNTTSFGNITDYHSAGKYEIVTLATISGNDVTFTFQMLNDYQVSGSVQLVRIPQYVNANITGALTAMPFDGCKGGILAIEVQGLVDLRSGSSIQMQGMGFRGYYQIQSNSSGCGSNYPDAFYPSTAGGRGAPKGEGIGKFVTNKDGGCGKQTSGGGGGNDHNAGGGGGANFGDGGVGGQRLPYTTFWCSNPGISNGNYPGIGGSGMSSLYSNAENRIFFGGAGGAGHDNNGLGYAGGAGGGIVMIRAGSFRGRNKLQLVRGESPSLSAADAGSGGGGGGTMIYDIGTWTDLHRLFVNGGDGADHSPSGSNNCMGPAGGGGGGVVWMSGTGIPAGNIGLMELTGGDAGIDNQGVCGGTTQGSAAGQNGSTILGLVIPESNTAPNNCVLVAKWADFSGYQAGRSVHLDWSTSSQNNSREFRIQRSLDGKLFENLSTIEAAGTSNQVLEYSAIDTDPYYGASFYRMQEIDRSGRTSFSPIIEIFFDPNDFLIQTIYPNPIQQGKDLTITLGFQQEGKASFSVFDMLGQMIWMSDMEMDFGKNEIALPTSSWKEGVYFLKVNDGRRSEVRRVVVTR